MNGCCRTAYCCSHAYVNAAFTLGLTGPSTAPTVTSALVAFGGVGAAVFRATDTENVLKGNVLNQATLVRVARSPLLQQ